MDFNELKKKANFDWIKVVAIADSGQSLDFEFEIEPEEFIEFAELDFQKNDKASLVNALSNAKRAIHCATDKIIGIFALKTKKDFTSKLELLQDIGVIAPRIISKVNKNRNFLEHQYKLPIKESVEDAIDIASLFVVAVRGVLHSVWSDFYIKEGSGDIEQLDNSIYFSFEEKKKQWEATLVLDKSRLKSIIKPTDYDYKSIVKIVLCQEINAIKEKEGILELARSIN